MTSNPLPDERRDRIVAELRKRGTLRVQELAALVGAAPVTLRRDLAQLASQGIVRRIHGGAALTEPAADEHVDERPPARIGLVVPSLDHYWPEVIQGAQSAAAEGGAVLVIRESSYTGEADQSHVDYLLQAGVDALLLAPQVDAPTTPRLLEVVQEKQVPFVLIEREAHRLPSATPLEWVSTDHVAGAGGAVEHLIQLGHERIGLVVSAGSPHREQIRRGWELALTEHRLPTDVITAELQRVSERDALADIVEGCRRNGTTALLVHADKEAIAIAQFCQAAGVRIPEDLSIVAYDDEVAAFFSPPLSAVRTPRASIGRAAVGLALERLKDPLRPAHRISISPRLNARQSSGKPFNPSRMEDQR